MIDVQQAIEVYGRPVQHIEEDLCAAYASAVIARAGMTVSSSRADYGVDLKVNPVRRLPNGKYREEGFTLYFQAKASKNCDLRDSEIAYDMEVGAYNQFRTWTGNVPSKFLILMSLPSVIEDWAVWTEEAMLLRKCCYWFEIPRGEESRNRSSVRIRIPRINTFTPESLRELMARLRDRG